MANNGNLINNRLTSITDPAGKSSSAGNVGSSTYDYDEIGNLTKDEGEGISNIEWNVYGKIRSVQKAEGAISYSYDASGNRVSKTYKGLTTWYLRDAQGNTLSIYDNAESAVNWREQHLYGSSRLGMWKPDLNLATEGGSGKWQMTGLKSLSLAIIWAQY